MGVCHMIRLLNQLSNNSETQILQSKRQQIFSIFVLLRHSNLAWLSDGVEELVIVSALFTKQRPCSACFSSSAAAVGPRFSPVFPASNSDQVVSNLRLSVYFQETSLTCQFLWPCLHHGLSFFRLLCRGSPPGCKFYLMNKADSRLCISEAVDSFCFQASLQ